MDKLLIDLHWKLTQLILERSVVRCLDCDSELEQCVCQEEAEEGEGA